MQQNVGGLDRTARILLGPVLVLTAIAAFTGYVALGAIAGTVSLIAGTLLLVTGTTRKCPAHKLTGIDTSEQ